MADTVVGRVEADIYVVATPCVVELVATGSVAAGAVAGIIANVLTNSFA